MLKKFGILPKGGFLHIENADKRWYNDNEGDAFHRDEYTVRNERKSYEGTFD